MAMRDTTEHLQELQRAIAQLAETANDRDRWYQRLDQFPWNVSGRLHRWSAKLAARLWPNRVATPLVLTRLLGETAALNAQLWQETQFLRQELQSLRQEVAYRASAGRSPSPSTVTASETPTTADPEENLNLDDFYIAFENRFRGTPEEIRQRLTVYLPYLEALGREPHRCSALDLGCGRGEWLELLREQGYQGRGLDLNRAMVQHCRDRGLTVIEQPAVEYLRSLPNSSLDIITGFHLIEHLPFPDLMRLFQETRRVLKPGGMAIFETPNPQNLVTASHYFYIDPTHRNPLPSLLAQFLLEYSGLDRVQVLPLHPHPFPIQTGHPETDAVLNEYLRSAQDYSVIGYKPA